MIIRIDRSSDEAIYLQLRSQIITAIARGELTAGEPLPSVRSLAGDLGINLHTVNKAYATLRDDGYVSMQGRAGARIADPIGREPETAQAEAKRIDEALYSLALEHRAHGGDEEGYLERARAQARRAFEERTGHGA